MVKPNTINLNSVRLNTVALNHYGNISGGGSKPDPIAVWIRKHMAFRYETKGYTNEVLSQTKQLEDLSGNNRPMLLNNFLFDMMSGMDGYNNRSFFYNSSLRFNIINDRTIRGILTTDDEWVGFGYYTVSDFVNNIMYVNWHVEGIKEDNKVYITQFNEHSFETELHNGDNYIQIDTTNSSNPKFNKVSLFPERPYKTDITITQIPEYPGALVTDGVDDYGVVQNMPRGVKMLFMTVNPIGDNLSKVYYDQRRIETNFTFCINANGIAYNNGNVGGKTYINGKLNTTIQSTDLFNVKHSITIVNDKVLQEDYAQSQSIKYFVNINKKAFPKLAFYNAIGFDSIPTEEDGFTEQELIDYVIEKYELNKI